MPDSELLPTHAACPVDPRHEIHDAVEQAWERLVADLRDGLAGPGAPRLVPERSEAELDLATAAPFDRRAAEFARDLLLARLHQRPDDLTATRALQSVSSALAVCPRGPGDPATRTPPLLGPAGDNAAPSVDTGVIATPLGPCAGGAPERASVVVACVAPCGADRSTWCAPRRGAGTEMETRVAERRGAAAVPPVRRPGVVGGVAPRVGRYPCLGDRRRRRPHRRIRSRRPRGRRGEIVAGHRYTPERFQLSPLEVRSSVYAADGSVLGALGLQDRELARFTDIPKIVVDAVVATEDRTFWENPGFDTGALLPRARHEHPSRANRRGRVDDHRAAGEEPPAQSQARRRAQAARDRPRRPPRAPVHQAADPRRVPQHRLLRRRRLRHRGGRAPLSHRGPRGDVPAWKRLDELTLGEAALLAGLIASPSSGTPSTIPTVREVVGRSRSTRMVAAGYISRAEADRADLAPLPSVRPPADLRPRNLVVDEVQHELLADPRLGATPGQRRTTLLTGGLTISTTIDPSSQMRALDAIRTVLSNQPPFTAAARRHRSDDRIRTRHGRRDRLRPTPVQPRHAPARAPARLHVQGRHARSRARSRLLTERHGERHLAMHRFQTRLPHLEHDQRRTRPRNHHPARRDRELGELRLRARHRESWPPRGRRRRASARHHTGRPELPADHARRQGGDTPRAGDGREHPRRRRRPAHPDPHRACCDETAARSSSTTRRGRVSGSWHPMSSTARPTFSTT